MAQWERETSVVPEPYEIAEGMKQWERELSSIKARHAKTVAAADADFLAKKEELDVSLEERRENQIATLNAEVHKYMTMVQAQMDAMLQELRSNHLVTLETEYSARKKELEKAYDRDRAAHWKRYKLIFDDVISKPVSEPCTVLDHG